MVTIPQNREEIQDGTAGKSLYGLSSLSCQLDKYLRHTYYMHIEYSHCEYSKIKDVPMKQKESGCCASKHQKMERFLEISLLMLLFDKKGYGYGLIEQLEDFGFTSEDLNIGSLYRSLRKLADQGLVSSVWEDAGQGPKRRVYTITAEGKDELHNWIPILKERKSRIEQLIETYEKKSSDTQGDKK